MKEFTHILQVLGIKKVEDLLFKVKPDLTGRAEDVEAFKENCFTCKQPRLISWKFKLDGIENIHRISPVCSACLKGKESKEVTDEMIQKRQEVISSKWYHIPDNDNSGLKNYETTNGARQKAKETATDYIKALLSGNLTINLLLQGSTGTGKSHIAKAVIRIAKEKGLSVAFIPSVALFDMIKGTFGNEKDYERLLTQYKAFDVVAIDDVGLETVKVNEASWSVREWTKLIEARSGKATIYTTNYDDVALAEVIGQRAFSRMYMDTRFIDLYTDDFRRSLRL